MNVEVVQNVNNAVGILNSDALTPIYILIALFIALRVFKKDYAKARMNGYKGNKFTDKLFRYNQKDANKEKFFRLKNDNKVFEERETNSDDKKET